LDAVHYAPHGPIDVQEWGCDALACSAYKFFGPHVGILWGKREFLEELPAYKVRPAPDTLPDRWMTGTQNHEGLAGVVAAVDYLAGLPRTSEAKSADRVHILRAAMSSVRRYESHRAGYLLGSVEQRPRIKVRGTRDMDRLEWR